MDEVLPYLTSSHPAVTYAPRSESSKVPAPETNYQVSREAIKIFSTAPALTSSGFKATSDVAEYGNSVLAGPSSKVGSDNAKYESFEARVESEVAKYGNQVLAVGSSGCEVGSKIDRYESKADVATSLEAKAESDVAEYGNSVLAVASSNSSRIDVSNTIALRRETAGKDQTASRTGKRENSVNQISCIPISVCVITKKKQAVCKSHNTGDAVARMPILVADGLKEEIKVMVSNTNRMETL